MAVAPLVRRLALGAGAVGLAALAGAWTAGRSSSTGELAMLVMAGCAVLALGVLARRPALVTIAALVLGAVHVISRVGHDVSVISTVAFGVALLIALELAWWSIDLHPSVHWEQRANARRARDIGAVAAGGAALAGAAGVTAVAGTNAGAAVFLAGMAAAPAVVWFGAAAARTATGRRKLDA